MPDLSSLNPANPADGEAVSQGASRIRDIVTAVQTSMDVEHTLPGIHSFINGAPASRPAASTSGRIFIDTTNARVEMDSGSAWAMLNTVQFTTATGGSVALTTGFQTLATATLSSATGARCVVLWQIDLSNNVNAENQARVLFDSVELFPGTFRAQLATAGERFSFTGWAYLVSGFAAGSHTIDLQALRVGVPIVTANASYLTVLYV